MRRSAKLPRAGWRRPPQLAPPQWCTPRPWWCQPLPRTLGAWVYMGSCVRACAWGGRVLGACVGTPTWGVWGCMDMIVSVWLGVHRRT